jgi:NTP pyrophosphatase (non-canonical NTP hydrolase)
MSIYDDIQEERRKQDKKWGVPLERNIPPLMWIAILVEEVGEVAKALLQGKNKEVRAEAVQVAAVAVAIVEYIDG